MQKDIFEALKKISQTITRNIDLEDTMKTIVNEVMDHLTSVGGAFFLIDEKHKQVRAYEIATTKIGRFILKTLGKDFRSLSTPFDKPINHIGRAVKEKRIIMDQKVSDFICPTVSERFADEIQRFGRVKTLVVLPAIMNEKVIGALLLGFRENQKMVKKKMAIMELFIDQVAIAINNALKYEELRKRYELERETTAILSHEIKTPLAIVHNNTSLLRFALESKEKNPKKLLKKISELQIGINRINQICNSIFILREVENEVPSLIQSINFNRSLRQTLETFQIKSENENIEFHYAFKIKAKNRYGAGIQFEQVATILLDNALKYTTEGKIEAEFELEERQMVCKVTDTGIGIQEKDYEKIFERFTMIDRSNKGKGLGLGLYIAKIIVNKLGGSIKIQKNPNGKGTCFLIRMPVYEDKRFKV